MTVRREVLDGLPGFQGKRGQARLRALVARGTARGVWLDLPVGTVLFVTPWWVRALRRLAGNKDRGVGDTLHRIFAWFGGKQYERTRARLGIPCGCAARRKRLNIVYPY